MIMAAQLYRAITGGEPQARDVTLDFPLLPANAAIKADAPMEGQPQLAGDGSASWSRPMRSRCCWTHRSPEPSAAEVAIARVAGTHGVPSAAIARTPRPPTMRPIRVTATPRIARCASIASRADAGAVKHNS